MNKKIIQAIFFSYFLIAQSHLLAQNTDDTQTLFKKGSSINTKNLGFFVAPIYGITQMDGSTASLFNLRGGITVKEQYTIGAYFSTSLNQINPQSETVPNIYMDYWSAGGFVEYTLLQKKLYHLTFPFYIGYGEVQMDNDNGDAGFGEATFFQIEPSALLEVNLHKNIRFNIGAGYRFVGEMDYRNFDQSNLSGLTGYVGLKFGLFR